MESDQTTIFILMCVGVTAVGSIGRALPSLAGFRSLLAFHDAAYCICMQPPRSAGWSWRLELECCERKILLGWLELVVGVVGEKIAVASVCHSRLLRRKTLRHYPHGSSS